MSLCLASSSKGFEKDLNTRQSLLNRIHLEHPSNFNLKPWRTFKILATK